MTDKVAFRAALIEDGIVINVILADEDFVIEGCLVVQSDTAEIGDLFDGVAFEKPALRPGSDSA